MKLLQWLVVGVVALLITSGCKTTRPPELKPLEAALNAARFDLWYPARENTRPGDIWRENSSLLSWVRISPDFLEEKSPLALRVEAGDAVLITTAATNVTSWTLGGDFLGDIAPALWKAEGEFKAGTVTSYSISFGKTRIEDVPLATFRDTNEVAKLPEGYRNILRKFKKSADDQILIASVVKASGLRYQFNCQDAKKLNVQASNITKLIGVKFTPEIKGTNSANWIIPNTKEMVIGVRFYTKGYLDLPQEEAIKLFAEALKEREAKNLKATAKKVSSKAKKKK